MSVAKPMGRYWRVDAGVLRRCPDNPEHSHRLQEARVALTFA
jgi:hypothetical protein